MPKRIQRKRTKGWNTPPNTVYVGRPTKWGNPWKAGESCGRTMTVTQAVAAYREWVNVCNAAIRIRRELRGKNLACWCPLDQPCHADVLLEIANAEAMA
jgi:hypothetical protein